MDKAITIQLFNSLNTFFVKFLYILNYETRKKEKFSMFESLAKSLGNKKL